MDEFLDDFGFSTEPQHEEHEEDQEDQIEELLPADDDNVEPDVFADEPKDDEEAALADVAASKPVKPKKPGTRRPLLDTNSLIAKSGVPALLEIFDGVKFKGRGHEVEDLNSMMAKLEYWAHQLCPRLKFDEVLAKIEVLGTKRPVQVALTKMRQGDSIQVTAEDYAEDGGDIGTAGSVAANIFDDSGDFGNPFSQNVMNYQKSQTVDLTEDQRRRIEENKRRAQERRSAKMSQPIATDDLDDILANLGPDFDKIENQQSSAASVTSAGHGGMAKPVQYLDDMDFIEEEDLGDEDEWIAMLD